ncbi:MAG TPA: ATP-binding protein, partial [Vicinamibacteria bacterium]|nr:ATP-binding protein [Vicinamibacteria bacterium]
RASIFQLQRTAGALRESQARLAVIHDQAPVAIALTRVKDATLVSVNDAFVRLFEFEREEVIGRTSVQLGITVDGDAATVAQELWQRSSVRDLEVSRRARSGRSLELVLSLDRVALGEEQYILTTIQDVTARKQAEKELRRLSAELRERVDELQTLLDIAPAAIWLTRDTEGRTITGNAYADEVVMRVPRGSNVSYSAAAGQAAVHYRPLRDGVEIPAAELPAQLAAATGKPVPPEEQELVFEDGRRVHLLVGAAPLFDAHGRVRGSIAAGLDVTRLKQVEQALREAARRKTQFLALLSHELRNPLAPITNSLYVLEHAVPGGEQARRAQEVIGRQVAQLARMVDDLLEVTRVTRGRIRLQKRPLELGDLVRRTIEDHRSLFEGSGVGLRFEAAPHPVRVCADENRIAQVVGNLLTNAAKFSSSPGQVTVTVDADAAASRAVLRVVDDGVGIAPEMLPRLFEPFTQADATLDRSRGGLGLGLSLVKGLVEQHGGTVEAASDGPGRGAVFTVRLPLAAAEATSDRQPPPAPVPSRRVLVIEDNVDAAESLRDLLELEGHCVAVAADGPGGVAVAREFLPEVVLCDVGLPRMDGYEVARAFRADSRLSSVRLVALTGYAQPDDLERATAAGFERHLAKPPDVGRLREVLA